MVSMPGKLGRCGIAAALVVSLGLVAGPAYADETPEPADLSGELLLDEERPSAEFLTDPAEVLAGIEDRPGVMARASAVVTAPPFDHTFVMTECGMKWECTSTIPGIPSRSMIGRLNL